MSTNEILLRVLASMGAGGLFASGLNNGDSYSWTVFGVVSVGLIVDFSIYWRKISPKLRHYTVMLKSQKTQQTKVTYVSARTRKDAINRVFALEPEPWMVMVSIEETKPKGAQV